MENTIKDELVGKVVNLHKRLKDLKAMKKSMNSDYKDQIKDVETELGDTIDELREGTE